MATRELRFSTSIHFRCSSEEKLKIEKYANKSGEKLSAYVRNIAVNTKIIPKATPQMFARIKMVGDNINKIARRANSEHVISTPDILLHVIKNLKTELSNLNSELVNLDECPMH